MRIKNALCFLVLITLFIMTSGCAYYIPANMPFEAATDGPPLFIYGKSDQQRHEYKGTMDRGVMVGYGSVTLRSPDSELVCVGNLDTPPSPKNRVYGILKCSDDKNMLLVLRNLGPDQGFILGTVYQAPSDEDKDGLATESAVFFYHPSMDEAERRLPSIEESFKELIKEFPNLQDTIYNKLKLLEDSKIENIPEETQHADSIK